VQLDQPQKGTNEPAPPVYRPRLAGGAVQTPYQPTPAGDPSPQRSTLGPAASSTGAQTVPTVDEPPPLLYTVRQGDNLWTIAEQHLATATGRPVEELHTDEVHSYWLRLVDANDDRIPSRDPDLIRPTEQIQLP
jgi:nucleoid-associated protein YgaU